MATEPAEARELQLVQTVEFRILEAANNEAKLQTLLERYLAPLLLKAGSDHASVRTKVIKFSQSLKTFIQPPGVVLPVESLLKQYKATTSPVIKQLDITFIQHSIGRLEDYQRSPLISLVTKGISSDSRSTTAAGLFNVLLKMILDLKIPQRGSKEDEALREAIGLSDAADAAYVADWFGKVLLLKLPPTSNFSRMQLESSNASLSPQELDFLRPERPETSAAYVRLPELRVKIAALLASGAFKDEERLLPALFAAASTDQRIASFGDDMLKRTSVSWEDEQLVKQLFAAHSKLPAPIRTRILLLLCKSEISTTMHANIHAVVNLDFTAPSIGGPPNASSLLQPSSGLERTKLHRALFQFITWSARMGPAKAPFTVGVKLVDKMKAYVEQQGWPVPGPVSADEMVLRSMAYEILGILGKATPMPSQDRFTLAGWLFRSLSEDPTGDVVVNIEGALSGLASHFTPAFVSGGSGFNLLRALLLHYMILEDEAPAVRSVRHVATKWANDCIAFSDRQGRWIDILAIAGRPHERSDVIEEGRRGLDPWTYRDRNESDETGLHTHIPEWQELIDYFFANKISPVISEEWLRGPAANIRADNNQFVFQNFPAEKVLAFPVAIEFCRRMMFLSALPDFRFVPDWARNLDTLVRTDLKTRQQIREKLTTAEEAYLAFFLKACFDGLCQKTNDWTTAILEESARSVYEIASLSPATVVAYIADMAKKLTRMIKSNNKEVRILTAKIIGVIGAHPLNVENGLLDETLTDPSSSQVPRDDTLAFFIRDMRSCIKGWEKAVGSELNAVEGALLAYGYLKSRAVYYGLPISDGIDVPTRILTNVDIPSSLQDVVVDHFAQLWTASLAVPNTANNLVPAEVIERLAKRAKTGNEKAIFALGRLALAFPEDKLEITDSSDAGLIGGPDSTSPVDSILRNLFSLHILKQVEVHFTVGEAITAAIACWDSEFVQLTLDVDSPPGGAWHKPKRGTRVTLVLDKLFKDCKSTAPSLLKASGIWLFCIVQYCSQLEEVQSRLRECQSAFMRLLSARDELVQETASRGLSLVYEKGDAALKDDLTRDLVSAFTGTSTQLKVDDDTELFEPGALPTGDGKSVTSYKDILSLANEVGDSSLIYKFMSLATNAATWSTRSAFGRFGLSNILSESEVDPKLYPKLFRYRFDPNTNVQRSMDDIWKALVKDSNATIDQHFDAIIKDLLKSILGKEWRTREASCAAISDLVSGRPFQKYEPYYEKIWTAALKVLDDVKGSVRAAALKLCMGLTTTIVRQLEEGSASATAQAMLKEALRFLLSPQGIESGVQDVQFFSLQTVIDITKHGGKALKPFVSEIVPHLLGLFSTIEPQQLNYYYQRVGEENRDKIDKARAQMVNQSPITDAIENCLRQMDAGVMEKLAPKLEETIKTAIGMPTKLASAKVLSDMVLRHRQDIAPVSARFLQMMERQTLDKNDEVSKAYARSAAYLMRVVPESSKERFSARFIDFYFSGEDETRRQKVGDVIVALSKVSPDEFSKLESTLLPFAYYASHDTDEYSHKAFEVVWNQHSGSSRTVARYVPEIVALVNRGLGANRWAYQHTSALTVAAMITAVANASDASGQIGDASLKLIWPVLDKSLLLKTFAGKEKLLESFPDFVSKGRSLWSSDPTSSTQMKKIVFREAKRNNEDYRVHAFKCLWRFAEARDDLDIVDDIHKIVKPIMDELLDESRMDVDSNDQTKKAASNGLQAIARGYNRPAMKTDSYAALGKVISLLEPYLSNAKYAGIKREVWYECVKDLMQAAASGSTQSDEDGLATKYLLSLDMDLVDVGTEIQRSMRATAIGAVMKAKAIGVFGVPPSGAERDALIEMVKKALEGERSLEIQRQLKLVLDELRK